MYTPGSRWMNEAYGQRLQELDAASEALVRSEAERRIGLSSSEELEATREQVGVFRDKLCGQLALRLTLAPDDWRTLEYLNGVQEEVLTRVGGIYTAVNERMLANSPTRRFFHRARALPAAGGIGFAGKSLMGGTGIYTVSEISSSVDVHFLPSVAVAAMGLAIGKRAIAAAARNVSQKFFGDHYRRYIPPIGKDVKREVKARYGRLKGRERADKIKEVEIERRLEELDNTMSGSAFKQMKLHTDEQTASSFARMYAGVVTRHLMQVWELNGREKTTG